MSLLPTLLAGAGGGGGGSGSVIGVILSPVVAASTTALTVTYANGSSGAGATLTNATTQAAFAIDGQSPTVGQRVLIKNQSTSYQNGVYTVTTVGDGTHNWVLTRSTDFNSAAQMTAGVLVEVTSGTVNAGTVWQLSATVATVGAGTMTFVSINITTKVDQNGSPIYGLDAVGTDSYAITLSPAPTVYTTGMVINFVAGTINTGAASLNINSLGAKTIVKNYNQTLANGDIAAGQVVQVVYDGTNFQMTSPIANVPAGSFVVQRVSTLTGAVATGTTGLPIDDTIPQNTEGDQYMSLSITPKNTANILEIKITVYGADSAASSYEGFAVALFQDSTANALAAMVGGTAQFAATTQTCTFSYYMAAGTTSSTTFNVRAGDPTGTFTFNGEGGGRQFGGVLASSIQITEYTS